MRDTRKLCVLLLLANAIALVTAQESDETRASPSRWSSGRSRSSREDSQKFLLARPNEEKDLSMSPDQHPVTVDSDTIVHTAVDPCSVAAGYKSNHMPYSVAKACLDTTFPFPTNSRKDTADTAKALISNFYVFEDMAESPPADKDYAEGLNFRPVKLVEEIDNLYRTTSGSSLSNDGKTDPDSKEDEEDEEEEDDDDDSNDGSGDPSGADKGDRAAAAIYLTDREFHDGISAILAKARDGHLSYDADCFRTFIFQHGFVMGHVARNGKKVIKVFDVKSYLWSSQYALASKIYGCDVISIEGQDAADYIQSWADQGVDISKDPNVRFNSALASPIYSPNGDGYFYDGSFGTRNKLPAESALSFTFKCGTANPFTEKFPWTATYKRSSFYDTRSYFHANCAKSSGIFSTKKKKPKHNEDVQPADEEEAADQKALNELYAQLRSLTISQPTGSADENPSTSTPSSVQHENSERINEIVARINALESQALPVRKFYDDVEVQSTTKHHGEAVTYQVLYKGKQGITGILLDDGKTGVIVIPKESSSDNNQSYEQFYSEWIPAIIGCIQALSPVAENLILDLSHNGGGYICMGAVLLKIFFPEDVPFVTNLRFTPSVKEQLSGGRLGITGYVSPFGQTPANAYQDGYYLQEKSYPNRGYSFSNFLLDKCPKDRFKLSMDPSVEANRKRTTPQTDAASYRPWDPENLAILTDGYCGSTCALISNTLRYKYDVPAVVVGGKSLASEERMSYSTFPGLHVVDDAYVFRSIGSLRGDTDDAALGHQEEGDFKEAKEPLPKAFGHKARQRMTYRQIYFTGSEKDQFTYSLFGGQYSPAWLAPNEEQSWNEYRFLAATHRIDYTDQNAHSINTIWKDARDAVWGTK